MPPDDVIPEHIYLGQDFYVPAFRIRIRGQEVNVGTHDVMNVTYSDSLTAIDSFDLSVNNWDADKRTFKYSDSALFNPWQDVELYMGYYRNGDDQRRLMLTGDITTLAPNFPANGGPTLGVRG